MPNGTVLLNVGRLFRERIEHIRASIQQLKEKGHQLAKEHNALKEKAEDLNRIAQGVKDEERKLVQRLGANRKLKDTLDVKKAQLARLQQGECILYL